MAIPTFSTMVRPTIPELSTSPMNKRDSNLKELANKRHCPTLAPKSPQISTPEKALQQAAKDEILEVVPVQPIVKHSPKNKITPIQKATHTTPKKIRADTTPAPKILEQCILEAEIEPEPKRTIQVVLEKTNSMVTVTSSKGPNKRNIQPKEKPNLAPIRGQNWQCKICRNFFITREGTEKHIQEVHNIYMPSRIKKNLEGVFCT
eukprot:TRINITY_DN30363_c0_g1_i1.p1 TRINITY_DN30363_c0_g1~~TRINITY_DN30363_c0_g1_i1.p1  ORF type:complete len:214 (-),score=47.42 TRINITY_DN30363_c0_g1_i1:130-744(-)